VGVGEARGVFVGVVGDGDIAATGEMVVAGVGDTPGETGLIGLAAGEEEIGLGEITVLFSTLEVKRVCLQV